MEDKSCDRKKELIEKAIKDPLHFTWEDLECLCKEIEFEEIRGMIKRIYNLNEELLKETSDASLGFMGIANKKANKKRNKIYKRRVKKGLKDNSKVIVAEGDSWFQFPFFITDIIDWLNKNNKHYVIKCLAYGGDWITNIIYEGKYIGELSVHKPSAFLVSGGGNDLVGGYRLAIMVNKKGDCIHKRNEDDIINEEDKKDILKAQGYITTEFYAFINTLKLMYHKMFTQLESADEFNEMKIITQGYDYPIPRWNSASIFSPLKSFVNWLVGTGKWLKHPLEMIKIPEVLQRPIVKTLLFEFNEMFVELAEKHVNVYHIDSRGIAREEEDWYDELHLQSHKFMQIAKVYQEVIDNEKPDKVTKVSN